jgi:hypothetical protein
MRSPEARETEKEIISPNQLSTFMTSNEAEPFLQEDNRIIGCIDGRVLPEGCLGLAGSGILLPRDSKTDLPEEKYMEILTNMVKKGELETLTWHKGHGGCGAAKIYLVSKGIENPTDEQAAEAAQSFAEKLGAELSRRAGKKVKVEEAEAPGPHSELGAYVDFTNKLDLKPEKATRELPNGFMMNPRLTNDFNYLVIELKVAIGIAFKHQTFSKENPFFIMLVDYKNNPLPIGELPQLIDKMIDEKYKEHKDKIKIQTTNTFAN